MEATFEQMMVELLGPIDTPEQIDDESTYTMVHMCLWMYVSFPLYQMLNSVPPGDDQPGGDYKQCRGAWPPWGLY